MKKQWVNELSAPGTVSGQFAVAAKSLREFTRGRFLSMTLADRTGTIAAVLWDDAEAMDRSLKIGDVIRVEGSVQEYRDSPQIKIDRIGLVDKGTVELGDYRESLENAAEVEARLMARLDTISNPWLKQLVGLFLGDAEFMGHFRQAAAAKRWHHGFHGGLLLHTTELVELAAAVAPLFPRADRDLLLAGAFVHDIGKIDELEGELGVDYSTAGRLLGHIVIGNQMVIDRIRRIKDFPGTLAMHLQHLVLSHQGELAFASPVVPKSLEAILLHQMDDLNAQANAFQRIILDTRKRDAEWSDYQNIIDRQIWAGEQK
ncbi:MAG: OB-fold nucleic acid binding domain-containing protein [Candidatus Eisenbacteria bacterium]|nr:OB-fold nucleic acid binding domain-containing protein [Candidatus Eisenbacteria bacterium]